MTAEDFWIALARTRISSIRTTGAAYSVLVDGHSTREAGAAWGVSHNTVAVAARRIRQALGETLPTSHGRCPCA